MFVETQKVTTVTIDQTTWALWLAQGESGGEYAVDEWSETAMREAVERVNRGALLLDEKKPRWVYGVIPENLDMSNAQMCIIGQAYGDYEQVGIPFGIPVYGSEGYDEHEENELAQEHGFLSSQEVDYNPDYIPYPLLDRIWVYMLQERHQRKVPVILAPPDLN